jgi:hypothetical protein
MVEKRLDAVTRKLEKDAAAQDSDAAYLLPSPDAATNLLIADIIVRGASRLFRESVKRRVADVSPENREGAQELLDGKQVIKSLALYGASKMATKSPIGLGVVAGGLALKTLYDRGKAVQKRRAQQDLAPPEDG